MKFKYITYLIHTLLIALTLRWVYKAYISFPIYDTFNAFLVHDTSVRPLLILGIPLIGIFLRSLLGWVLKISYFYFLFFHILYKSIHTTDTTEIIIGIVLWLVLLGSIVLLNHKKVSPMLKEKRSSDLITLNILASSIGIAILIGLSLWKSSL